MRPRFLASLLNAAVQLVPLALLCALLWLLAGAAWALGVLAAALALVHIRNAVHFSALLRWFADTSRPVPVATGQWEEAFEALHRYARRSGLERESLSALLVRFRNAVLALPDGLMVLDADGHIEWCNPTAEAFFGIDLAKDAGQPVANLVRQPDFGAYMARGSFQEPLTLRVARDGLVLSVRVVPYGNEQKLLLTRDITQTERLETVRRDFVANVSHEMKTPLTVVSGFLEMLADGKLRLGDSRSREVIGMMREQTERMARLIEDLLTLSALESSTNPPEEKPVDMAALVRCVQAEGEAISAGAHKLVVQLDGPPELLGSEHELHSAFSNIVSNAVRYSPGGGEIQIAWATRGDRAVFSVADGGVGIEARHIPRLTERFYRVDRGRSRETGGTGLGLAIVKHVATRHQAVLEVESVPGRGSRFGIVFPSRRSISGRSLSSAA